MMFLEQYRPPGRSARSGRSQADNDVFEGLPVKQWGLQPARISLAPPASEDPNNPANDKWGEPPMPRDYQLLQPWTQQLLRLARSGKVGTKRKAAPSDHLESGDEEREGEQEAPDEPAKPDSQENRGYIAKKWKPIPEAMLEPEAKHFEFLAKRRAGLPSLYGPDLTGGTAVSMRKTKVLRTTGGGEAVIYEVLVPEGQAVEGEVSESTEIPDVKAVSAAPGTVIEGVGIANDDGVLVAEHLKPSVAPRRNRPPPKKKGGPGRGKKRVTFTNPDGSTYTTIVPNATKIVPQPGQTVKHVSKGEEAAADVSATQAAQTLPTEGVEEGEEGDEGDEEGEEGDEDDDREEGELSDDDTPATNAATPAPPTRTATADAGAKTEASPTNQMPAPVTEPAAGRDPSSSPELPLAKTSHSRSGSLATAVAATTADRTAATDAQDDVEMSGEAEDVETFDDGEEDLLGSLEKSLENGDGQQGD